MTQTKKLNTLCKDIFGESWVIPLANFLGITRQAVYLWIAEKRKVPKVGVLNTWNNVYGNINRYKSELGDNLVLYQSDAGDLQDDVDKFNSAASQGKLKEYFEDLIAQDPDKYASTFRKSDKGLSP